MDAHKREKEEGYTDKEEVWRRFVSGEDEYFKEVFNSYFKSMYGYGFKLCRRPELVKDCIQELFRNIWERKDELGHINSPQVYLFVSLRRNVLKKVKKQRKTEDLGTVNEASIQFFKEELIIRDEEKFQQKKDLENALNQLPNRQREVIYLYYYSGMSYGEIEQILSINRQSVRNHVYRAMERLRSLLPNEVMRLVKLLLIVFLF